MVEVKSSSKPPVTYGGEVELLAVNRQSRQSPSCRSNNAGDCSE